MRVLQTLDYALPADNARRSVLVLSRDLTLERNGAGPAITALALSLSLQKSVDGRLRGTPIRL
jgi:hypothetical protein